MPFKCSALSCKCGKYTAPMRHVMSVILVFCLIVGHSQRVSLHIAIVDMVLPIHSHIKSESCPSRENISGTVSRKAEGLVIPRKEWNQNRQSFILLAYFIGYSSGHMPLGFFCNSIPVKGMAVGVSVATICNGLIPVAVMYLDHWMYVVVLRVIAGVAQSVFFPCITVLLSNWIPAKERGVIGGAVYSAVSLGIILGTLLSGLIIEYSRNWTWVFYFWTVLGFMWLPIFLIYVRAEPSNHHFISDNEKDYLDDIIPKKEIKRPPIKKILADPVIWAVLSGQLGYAYIYLTLQINLPKYMSDVLKFEMRNNALVSSLPYVGQYTSSVLSGFLIDHLIQKNYNIGCLRKIYTFIATFVPSVCLLLAGYSKCNSTAAISYFAVSLFFSGIFNCGLKVNVMDMTINHPGFLMSLVHGVGNLAGVFAPYVIGAIAYENTSEQWITIFWISFTVPNILCVIYLVFGTGKRRKWDYEDVDWALLTEDRKTKDIKWYQEKSFEDSLVKTRKSQGSALSVADL